MTDDPANSGRPLQVFIVDDEPLAVRRLTRLLEATGRVVIEGSTTDPEEALRFLQSRTIDALFLDIEMPGMNGFALVSRLERQPLIVFTTAFDRYALQAFEVNSIDYLLKPIEPRQLDRALTKLETLRAGGRQEWAARSDVLKALEEISRSLKSGRQEYSSRIPSRLGERVLLLEVSQITHFFAKDKLTYASFRGREHIVDASIAELERRLDPRHFARIHRATMVNLDWVLELDSWIGPGILVRLRDQARTELAVARDRVQDLKSRLGV